MNEYDLGCQYYTEKNYEVAYKIFLKLANNGDLFSQKMLANMLISGTGIMKSEVDGYYWMKKAADQNDAESEYFYGWYVIQNGEEKKGLKYIEKAATENYLDAVYDLAGFYYHGIYSCEKNIKKAVDLYKSAFLLGKTEAMTDLIKAKSVEVGKLQTIIFFLKNISLFWKAKKK